MSRLKTIVDRTTAAAKKKANDAMSLQKTRCVKDTNQHCLTCLKFAGRIFPAPGGCPGVRTTKRQVLGRRSEVVGVKTKTSDLRPKTLPSRPKTLPSRPKTSDLRPVCFTAMSGRMEWPYNVDLAGKLTPIDGQEEFWEFRLFKGCWQRQERQRTEDRGQKTATASPLTSNLSPAVKGVAA